MCLLHFLRERQGSDLLLHTVQVRKHLRFLQLAFDLGEIAIGQLGQGFGQCRHVRLGPLIEDCQGTTGIDLQLLVVLPGEARPQFGSALEFLESLPPGPRAFKTWEEYEQHLREERNSWDR